MFTHRDLDTPQLSTHLAGDLQCDLCTHGDECLGSAQGATQHTLAGGGTVHTEVLLHAVVFVLPVAGQDHDHLDNTKTTSTPRIVTGGASRRDRGYWTVCRAQLRIVNQIKNNVLN